MDSISGVTTTGGQIFYFASPATDAVSTEMASLQAEMADNTGAYWNGPEAATKQARYRELIETQDGAAPAQDGAGQDVALADGDVPGALDALSGMGEIGADYAAELGRSGAQVALETIMSVESDILADMGEAAEEVSRAFTGLPSNCQGAIYREFASAYVPQQSVADPDELNEFAESGAGRILVSEWGESAGRNLATALFRWDRMTENLSERDVAAVDDFYLHRLGASERASVLRRLAA